jgi:hypothetical protein
LLHLHFSRNNLMETQGQVCRSPFLGVGAPKNQHKRKRHDYETLGRHVREPCQLRPTGKRSPTTERRRGWQSAPGQAGANATKFGMTSS